MKKLNLLALLLFIAGAVSVFTLNTPTTRAIQQRVMAILAPFIHSSAAVQDAVSAGGPSLDPRQVQKDNEELRIQLQNLKIIAQKYNQLIEENNILRKKLDYKQSYPFKISAARVVKRSSTTWWNTLIIDKGSLDGIGTDSPVITDIGLVGKTGKLAPHMAEVILLTDESCRVSAKVEGTLEQGILSGERGGLEVRPNLRLKFLSRDAAVNIGSNVYSSGEGGVFPAGILLGQLKRFENRDITGEGIVEPAVDFSSIEHVFVVEMEIQVDKQAPTPAPPAANVPRPAAAADDVVPKAEPVIIKQP